MMDDLETLTIPAAVEIFNRAIRAARLFYLQLHSDSRFNALDLQPFGTGYRMWRNGASSAPTQPEKWFETTVIASVYRRPQWEPAAHVFVNFDLAAEGPNAALCAGACSVGNPNYVTYSFAEREPIPSVSTEAFQRTREAFPTISRKESNEWLYSPMGAGRTRRGHSLGG
jgi:hypothetical protein